MSNRQLPPYEFVTDVYRLADICQELAATDWIAFDTEFISEKRFETLLCLIQVSSSVGNYIIDTLTLADIQPFLQLLTQPNLLKITHAGVNDYKVLYQLYEVIPVNTFDTQIAAGFVGYKYPSSFQFLTERELNVHLHKGYAVTDWEARPIQPKQLDYALEDVIYLKKLHEKLSNKLTKLGRMGWAQQEFDALSQEHSYALDPNKEALTNNLITTLPPKEQLFLLRLYDWRRRQARYFNYSKEMILPAKYIAPIVKNIRVGKEHLLINRRIPKNIIQKNWEEFQAMYENPPLPAENAALATLQATETEDELYGIKMDVLYQLMQYICEKAHISPAFVWTRTSLNKMKADKAYFDEALLLPWRKELLGESFLYLLQHRQTLDFDFLPTQIVVYPNPSVADA